MALRPSTLNWSVDIPGPSEAVRKTLSSTKPGRQTSDDEKETRRSIVRATGGSAVPGGERWRDATGGSVSKERTENEVSREQSESP